MRETRAEQKYGAIERAARAALTELGKNNLASAQAAFVNLVTVIDDEIPSVSRLLMVSGAPTGVKTTIEFWDKYLKIPPTLGVAFSEIFSADLSPVPKPSSVVSFKGEAQGVVFLGHALEECHPVGEMHVTFQAVEPNYPVQRTTEMIPVTHTPAVIPPQNFSSRNDRRFLRLVGQTTVMVDLKMDIPQETSGKKQIVCSCFKTKAPVVPFVIQPWTDPFPPLGSPAIYYHKRTSPAAQLLWISNAINRFHAAWTNTNSNTTPPAGMTFLKQLSRAFD